MFDSKRYKCLKCVNDYAKCETLRGHYANIHNLELGPKPHKHHIRSKKAFTDKKVYKCEPCNRNFNKKSELDSHNKTNHPEVKIVIKTRNPIKKEEEP